MNIFSKLFSKKEINKPFNTPSTEEGVKIVELYNRFNDLLSMSHYVAKSEYLPIINDYSDVINYFTVLKNSNMLEQYCQTNNIDKDLANEVISDFTNIEKIIDDTNEHYLEKALISEKDYLDNILRDVDPVISLDDDQRKVVLSDEDYSLVIAGAGAGKTTTVAAKVKYLVERKNIEPKDILVISFTNKAVGELRDKINKDLKIDCPIATFHSTGNAILNINNPEKLNIVDESRLYFLLLDYFKGSVMKNESMVNNLIRFFASYFDAPYEGDDLNAFFNKIAKANYSTMKSDFDEIKQDIVDTRTKKKVTIRNEIVRSYQEVEIANFLYLNNVEYEYEPKYPYVIPGMKRPYTPDFLIKQGEEVIYIEHFGISEDGNNTLFSAEDLENYKKHVNDKVMLHRTHNTKLIYTFSSYKDHKSITEHLKEQLIEAGIELTPKSNEEIMAKLISSEESRYIRKLINLICRFIHNFKTNGYTAEEFDRMYHSTQNVRSRLFLNICQDCYLEYQRYLKENDAVDFEDMINESARVLREVKEMKQRLNFKYIIVDEYQDISRQRFDLTKALSEVCDGKIIAVGDDWQSIYAFSGSDITLFTQFKEKMGYAKLLKIVKTYRNAQDVIDIAGGFIQKNPTQITKSLESPKRIDDPVIIYTYDSDYKIPGADKYSGKNYAMAKAVETAIEQILAYNKENNRKNGTILILGRFGFDADLLERSGLFEYQYRGTKITSVKYPKLKMTFMTVHSSKGLGYDDVIIINGKNELYGFPSKIEDDPVLSFVIKGDRSIDYAEERRLFYVALTRTKNRVYCIAPEKNPSEFLLEIKRDYKNVVLNGTWNEEEVKSSFTKKTCPICGYPLQFRYKRAYGLRLYMCTNEPEICSFMTNEIAAGKMSIMKCDKCIDGYLIVRKGKNGYFLGCTNYKSNGSGCNNMISSMDYYTLMNMAPEKVNILNKEKKTDKSNSDSENESSDRIDISRKKKINELITYKGNDLHELVKNVILALKHISERRFFGITVLIGVLRGSEAKTIVKYDLNLVEEYGIYSNISKDDLRALIQWLIDNHYMLRTKERYPVLHMTYEGNHYDECITKRQLKAIKEYLESPNREFFEDIYFDEE